MMKVPSYFVNMSHLYLIYIAGLHRFLPYPLHTYKTYEVSYANRYLTRPCTSYTYEEWRLSSSQSSHTCMLCTFEDRKISIAYTYKTLKNLANTWHTCKKISTPTKSWKSSGTHDNACNVVILVFMRDSLKPSEIWGFKRGLTSC